MKSNFLYPQVPLPYIIGVLRSSSLNMQVSTGIGVSITIHQKLNCCIASESQSCIFKVHNLLRKVNEQAYEPEIISIGPYHRGKINLQMMEEHKLQYLKVLLQRKNENVTKYLTAIKPLEEKARKCYADPIALSSHEFVEMMVLDGCFIIELMRKFKMERNKNDPIFKMRWILNSLQRDLMLFENQLPFFILTELYKLIVPPHEHNGFRDLALEFFNDLFPGQGTKREIEDPHKNIKHLLDLIHRNWSSKNLKPDKTKWELIHSSTDLKEAGIKFEKVDKTIIFDIEFKDGIFRIPTLVIEDRTESFFRNLIAHEQYSVDTDCNIVTDYVTFLWCLLKSANDVAILAHPGIVENLVGDNEAIFQMFDKISTGVTGPSGNFLYAEEFSRVNVHFNRRMNRWMAKLRRKYMNSPWGIISIIAASLLLLLTFTQTIFQILPGKGH